jgi:hypothetical protein
MKTLIQPVTLGLRGIEAELALQTEPRAAPPAHYTRATGAASSGGPRRLTYPSSAGIKQSNQTLPFAVSVHSHERGVEE